MSEQQPYSTGRQASSSQKQPSSTEQQPPSVEEQPSSTEQQPSSVEEQPSSTEQQPSSVEEQPSSVEEQPSSTEQQPSSVEEQPSSTEQQPSSVEEQSFSSQQQPYSTKQQSFSRKHPSVEQRSFSQQYPSDEEQSLSSFSENEDDESLHQPSALSLPVGVWLDVFRRLDTVDLLRVGLVCRLWQQLAATSWRCSVTRLSYDDIRNAYLEPGKPGSGDLLEVALRQCGRKLESLALQNLPLRRLTPRLFALIGENCASVQELDLNNNGSSLGDNDLVTLARSLPCLKSLSVMSCPCIGECGLRVALHSLPFLQVLNISRNEGISGLFLCQAPPSLREVNAEHCSQLAESNVCGLAARCPDLERLNVTMTSTLTARVMRALIKNCKKLRKVQGMHHLTFRWDQANLESLHTLPLLEDLHVMDATEHGAIVTNQIFSQLSRHCPAIRALTLHKSDCLTAAAFTDFVPWPHLKSAHFGFSDITDEWLMRFATLHAPHLNWISLDVCPYVTDKGMQELVRIHPHIRAKMRVLL